MQNRLLAIRKARKIKRVRLSEDLNIDYSTLYRWEVKQAPIPYERLMQLAYYFEVTPVILMPGLGEVPTEAEVFSA